MTTTTQHTSGPWKVEAWDYDQANPPRRELVIQNEKYAIAKLAWDEGHSNPYIIEHDTALANARLIAAAPELLEALEACITDDANGTLNTGQRKRRLEKIDEIAKKAIAKATGKE